MAAQISFAQMFSLQLWHFQCSDEISFVSASRPLNLDFFLQNISIYVFFWERWKMKKTKDNFWNFPTTKQKNNVQPISTYLRKKTHAAAMRATVREFLAFFSGVAATLLLTLATDGDRDSPTSCREPS